MALGALALLLTAVLAASSSCAFLLVAPLSVCVGRASRLSCAPLGKPEEINSTSSLETPPTVRAFYSTNELKLKGGGRITEYTVQLPKGLEMPFLSDVEEEKLRKKIEDQTADPNLTDLEILKRDLQRLLDSM